MKLLLLVFVLSSLSWANESYYKNGELVELKLSSHSRSLKDSSINYYQTKSGKKIGVKNEILLKCKGNVDCSSFLKSYDLTNYSKLTKDIFIVKVFNSDVFSVSRSLYETGKVEFVHPNFINKKRKR